MRLALRSNRGALRSTSVMAVLTLFFAAHGCKVGLDHLLHQLVEAGFVPPAEPLMCLGGIAEQEVNLGGPEIAGVDFDQHLPRACVDALFIDARAAPFDAPAYIGEGLFSKLA